MRSEQQPIHAGTDAGYRFHFQITSGVGRRACTVEVQAPSMQDAAAFFRSNWPAIEAMARENLSREGLEENTIRLAVPQ
jgi:hypothetical protein